MNWGAFITCAVTGSGETAHKSDKVPVTPEQIANSCIEAAKAGAAVVHIHVRNPQTGLGSRDTELYAEVVDRVRSSDTDVVINLTAGMGGTWCLAETKTCCRSQPAPTWRDQQNVSITSLAYVQKFAHSTVEQ